MNESQDQLHQLQKKLDELLIKQEQFHKEIGKIRDELNKLKELNKEGGKDKSLISEEAVIENEKEPKNAAADTEIPRKIAKPVETESILNQKPVRSGNYSASNIERFIGENLINKIGIIITVIGVAIGTKYAIDNDLISPVTRIILGYLMGAGLLFFAIRLKKSYENFSAVLISGSMAIFYFITYAAFSFYQLYPRYIAFILMVIVTVFTVTAALRYDREIISIFGLVGAYAVPFLIGDKNSNATILFIYITIINAGILTLSFKKYWKPLYLSAFSLTWLIWFTWFLGSYHPETDFTTASLFLSLYFVIFYLTFLAYKLNRKEKFDVFDIILLLSNSFIFYGVGYSLLHNPQDEKWLGLMTLGNAIIHLSVSIIIYRNKLADRNLFYLVSGLFIVFVAIAIPVQLSGNWVTLLWICQAALLLYIGKTRTTLTYEYLSYPLILLAFLSLAQDWSTMQKLASGTDPVQIITPLFNIYFLTSVIFIAAFAFILRLYFSRKYDSNLSGNASLKELLDHVLPLLFIIVVYFTFSNEITAYWNHKIAALKVSSELNDLTGLKGVFNDYLMIWRVNYSLIFFAALSIINSRFIRVKILSITVFWISLVTVFFFLFQSLYLLSDLRENLIIQQGIGTSSWRSSLFFIRYVSFLFVGSNLFSTYLIIRQKDLSDYYEIIFRLLLHLTILWVLSSEMLNIMALKGNSHSYRFGLSILAGIYSFLLIVLGISLKRKYLRIAAISLFGVTLAKLFFYDITRLDIVLKTILFMSLGILMLIISFLYNKYKNRLFGETGE